MSIIHSAPAPARKEEEQRINTGELATQLRASYSQRAIHTTAEEHANGQSGMR
jgi:hypothetical protein